ncbi:alpha/beta fold hydrolase [Streptomyces hirsutus]|uniref:alpha/beta fold hydrolase n=1 Tax=Streptomyces hirsutus TaxID=35620 RepID=UPI0006E41A55|nr:alpha/beta hydrolase [Streptomyces hirsutus]
MPETVESFLSAVHRTFAEVTRKAPGYFATRPLRADDPPAGAAEAVRAAFGVTLRATVREEFTAVDDLLDRRRTCLDGTDDPDGSGEDWAGWRRRQDRRFAVRSARAARLARTMDRREVRTAGSRIRYRAGGQGPLVVLLTALGYTDEVWYPLAERLLPGRRVVMWDAEDASEPDRLRSTERQLDVVDGVLAAEGARACDVVGWCSGAQLAVEYAHSRPRAVRAAVLLHGSYPRAATDPASAYERNLATVCASVAARPHRADRALRMLTGAAEPAPLPTDEHLAALEVLARVLPGLAPVLRHPFRDADALVRYSRMLDELWRRPLPAPSPGLPPLLSLAAELDRVAAPEPPAALVPLLAGRHGLLVGATHYSLLERPEVVADMCRAFLDDPAAAVPVAGGPKEVRWAATDRPLTTVYEPIRVGVTR